MVGLKEINDTKKKRNDAKKKGLKLVTNPTLSKGKVSSSV